MVWFAEYCANKRSRAACSILRGGHEFKYSPNCTRMRNYIWNETKRNKREYFLDNFHKHLFQSTQLTRMEAPCLGALNSQAVCNLHLMFPSVNVHPVTKPETGRNLYLLIANYSDQIYSLGEQDKLQIWQKWDGSSTFMFQQKEDHPDYRSLKTKSKEIYHSHLSSKQRLSEKENCRELNVRYLANWENANFGGWLCFENWRIKLEKLRHSSELAISTHYLKHTPNLPAPPPP